MGTLRVGFAGGDKEALHDVSAVIPRRKTTALMGRFT